MVDEGLISLSCIVVYAFVIVPALVRQCEYKYVFHSTHNTVHPHINLQIDSLFVLSGAL